MNRTKWLDRNLFISPLYFCLCVTEEEFHQELKRLDLHRSEWPKFVKTSHSDATTHFFIHSSGKQCAIVCMPIRDDKPATAIAGLLVHEATHIWQEVRMLIGEKEPSAEFEAYSMQAICQELFTSYAAKVSA